jgi:hypothetical protein
MALEFGARARSLNMAQAVTEFGGGMVVRLVRWCLATAVTIVAFAAATWVSRALVLPHAMSSADIRWPVAAGCCVAVAALAALWGHSFATRDATAAVPPGKTVSASGKGSIAVGGDISGTASTGGRAAAPRRPAADGDRAQSRADAGTVTASGRTSSALSGGVSC